MNREKMKSYSISEQTLRKNAEFVQDQSVRKNIDKIINILSEITITQEKDRQTIDTNTHIENNVKLLQISHKNYYDILESLK